MGRCPVLSHGADEAPAYHGALTIVFANDIFAASDNNFSTGQGFTWTSAEVGQFEEGGFWNDYVDFWSFLPQVGEADNQHYVTFSLGQSFATASDISDPFPPLDDQPYAGLLAALTGVHARSENSLHNWWLMAGVIGPSSGAEDVQKTVHEITGSDEPQGWDTQLKDEFVINAYYDWKHRLATWNLSDSAAFDLTTSLGAGLGNAWIGAYGSAMARIGFNLPENFGPSFTRTGLGGFPINIQGPSERWQTYLYGGADLQAVGHNIFLDGNTFQTSRSVEREPIVAAFSVGMGIQKGPVVLNWSLYKYTNAYKTQKDRNEFGGISLSVFF